MTKTIYVKRREEAAWNEAEASAKAQGVSLSHFVAAAVIQALRKQTENTARNSIVITDLQV